VSVRALKPEEFFIEEEPYYEPVGDELAVFAAETAADHRLLS
jgi:nitric oxide reductase NorQ protein